jgi:hypothetical protein
MFTVTGKMIQRNSRVALADRVQVIQAAQGFDRCRQSRPIKAPELAITSLHAAPPAVITIHSASSVRTLAL